MASPNVQFHRLPMDTAIPAMRDPRQLGPFLVATASHGGHSCAVIVSRVHSELAGPAQNNVGYVFEVSGDLAGDRSGVWMIASTACAHGALALYKILGAEPPATWEIIEEPRVRPTSTGRPVPEPDNGETIDDGDLPHWPGDGPDEWRDPEPSEHDVRRPHVNIYITGDEVDAAELGRAITRGIARGIERRTPDVRAAARQVIRDALLEALIDAPPPRRRRRGWKVWRR